MIIAGSTTDRGDRSSFSQKLPSKDSGKIMTWAVGEDVICANGRGDGTVRRSGISFAAPAARKASVKITWEQKITS